MDRRQQKLIYDKIRDLFTATSTTSAVERGARVLEEALEAAQAFGVPLPMALKLAARVYERPPGVRADELAQVVLTAMAAAEHQNMDLAKVLEQHLASLLRPSAERLAKWHRNERDKIAAGICIPRAVEEPE